MTLLDCKTSFELYDSHALAQNPYSLLNYGETREIKGVRTSFEKEHAGRITYVQDSMYVKSAYIDDDHEIQKDTVLTVDTDGRIITDAAVFD